MTVPRFPKALILFAILALAGAVVVAGCGGGSSTTEAPTEEAAPPAEEQEEAPAEEEAEEEPAEEEPAEEPAEEEAGGEEGGGGEAALVAEGKTVFSTDCGSCHTLKDAGTSGQVGPDLDELEPDLATVEHQVENGGGGMPAFGKEGTLSPEEIKAVATYVSSVAGKG